MSDQGATAQAKDKAQEVAGQAQEKAQEAADQAKSQLRSQIDERSTTAGRQISSQASDLRSVGEQLRRQGKEQPAKLADQAAERIEAAGNWLTESDADRILHDVEDFARRQPWAVMAGGLAAGFLASRFLKASSRQRYDTTYGDGRAQLPRTTTDASSGEERFTRTPGPTPAVPATGIGGPAQPGTGAPVVPPAPHVPPAGTGTGAA